MARAKVSEHKRRKKINVTIDPETFDMLNEYMIDNDYDVGDKSKLVEKFIKNEIKKKK